MEKVFFKPKEDLTRFTKEADEYLDLDIDQFVKAFNLFIQKKRKIEEVTKRYTKVYREKTSIEDKISEIKRLLKEKKKVSFSDIVSDPFDKYEIIVAFVSILELLRQKSFWVIQNTNFAEIYLTQKKIVDEALEIEFDKEHDDLSSDSKKSHNVKTELGASEHDQ